ncbi:MAG: iron-containing alcohol dehydrogenase [Verrucomicrobiota bacterium]
MENPDLAPPPSDFVGRFAHAPNGLVIQGAGVLRRLGSEARAHGRRVLLITDPGVREAGHAGRALQILKDAGLQVELFDEVEENPTDELVERVTEVARRAETDLFVGLGGGSSLDTAKGANFLLTNGGRIHDYWGTGKAKKAMRPFIAVPTTTGTGSECQSFALISDRETHVKMACGDPKAAAQVVLLDPELTLSQPESVFLVTLVDALSHAVESAVSTKASEISRAYSYAAFRALEKALVACLEEGRRDLASLAQAQLGAALAGVAIENSMLGAAHATANPLTANYGIVHGHAVGLMLPAVVRRNAAEETAAEVYRTLAPSGDLGERLDGWLGQTGLERRLRNLRVPESDLPRLAEQASEQWTGKFNPLPLKAEDFESLYRLVY